ncbi:MAG: DNA helicase RecQ [Desulfobacterales bacterium]
MTDQAKTILKSVFGYDEFRPLQAEIIASVLSKEDTLVIMPTGGGKSLCYQVPALILKGLTIVVSPLISLMKDQMGQLTELGVAAVVLNSSLTPGEYRRNVSRIKQGKAKLLYLAPETLLKPGILEMLSSSVRVDCITIDEAHCISEWGHDFRPEYRQIVEVKSHFPEAVCLALTATATPRVQGDIKNNLKFDGYNEFIASFDRENLFIQVVLKDNPLVQTLDFLEKFQGQSGIIYCFSRRQVDELSQVLNTKGFSVRPYHAGLTEIQRKQNQELFINDDVHIIVATIAFGMGINKPNVRFVIHYDMPKNIESYYQEIGRAGRDGLRAHCLLLFSYADIRKIKYFIDQKPDHEQRVAGIHLNAFLRFIESDGCRRIPLLNYFGEAHQTEKCDMCDNCLAGEQEKEDITVAAQKFLSCVRRTGERFGAGHIIDVLRGSEAKKVLRFGHQRLSTYGIGKEYSKKQWFHLSRQFIQKGLIIQDMEYGGLEITAKAWDVFQGKETVFGRLEKDQTDKMTAKKKDEEFDLDIDRNLFEILRKERKRLADDADLPPYVIFSDKSLMQMAAYFPQSLDSFREIYGVGNHKLEKYGSIFLDLLHRYCKTHGIQETPKKEQAAAIKPKLTRKPRYIEVGETYNAGQSVSEIMAAYSIKQNTVVNHLFKYLQDGHILRSEGLRNLSNLTSDQQKVVLQEFDNLGPAYLRSVFDACKEEIDFDELRILQVYYLSKHGFNK